MMVRLKEEEPSRQVRVSKRVAAEPEVMTSKGSRLMRGRRTSGAKRGIFALVIVAVFLAVGWFAARAVVGGINITTSDFWTTLFSGKTAKLIGEDQGRVNVLLLGNPGDSNVDGPLLTDTMMVASYGIEDKTLHLFSVPRDLYIDVPNYGMTKINAVYEIGDSKFNDGPGTTMKVVGSLLGLDIPYYAKVDFEGFKQIVDELGGVTVEVKKDLLDPYYPTADKGYETLDIKAGVYTMDGDMALKYVRSRQTTSDFDRAKRQQQVLIALRDKALNLELLTAPSKMFAMESIIKDHFSTNLTQSEAKRALQLLADLDTSKVINKVFDDSPSGLLYGTKVDEMFVLKPVNDDYSKIAQAVQQILTLSAPAAAEEELPPLKIEVLNGTNITGLAGKVADELKQAGFDVVKVGNNPTRGFTDSVIYDGADGKRFSAIKQAADIVGATISTDTVSLTGADARLVVGSAANK